MKTRYTTIDLRSAIAEIQKSEALGLRLFNVYDIDNKTYLLRLTHGDKKMVILIESGNRIHLTEYDWPKNMMPSGFSMKCRKHLKGRRLASIKQLGIDRIIDLTFGYDEAAYHFIVELYDRGNIILTDYQYNILQLLRNRTDTDKDVKFAVREMYPVNLARQYEGLMEKDKLKDTLLQCKPGENLKRVLNPLFVYGPAVLEHCLSEVGLQSNMKLGQQFKPDNNEDMDKLMLALENAERILNSENTGGYIIQKKEKKVKSELETNDADEHLLTYTEFHPFLFMQHKDNSYLEFPSFNKSVDEFFSKLEGQKFEMNALRMEKAALKRLENVKQDHENRLKSLKESQDEDAKKAELIEMNLPLVEKAIATINSAIANQIDWDDINDIVQEAKDQMDSVALTIKSLQLETNHIVLSLTEPYVENISGSKDENLPFEDKKERKKPFKADVKIDLGLTAFGNARSMHNKRRNAALKEVKTVQASKKALKSAEKKTKETLKEVQTSKLISKTRKAYWFEKFYWFISSENYLVIGGRDQQQNELIVKRYLRPGDLYVHADLHGASSVILKNPSGGEVPPKTMNDAGTMAICYSAAWDARVVTSAWWVHHHQVSKTAPSGEYLTTGSFMIRGKKNYLPPSYLIMGYSVLFKLDESCISKHINDRKVRLIEEDRSIHEIKEEEDDDEVEISLDDNHDDNSPVTEETPSVTEDTSPVTDGISPDDTSLTDNITGNASFSVDSKMNEMKIDDANDDEFENRSGFIKEEEGDLEKLSHDLEGTKDSEEQGEEDLFPDTNIELQHISGEKYQLHRGVSSTSSQHDKNTSDGENEDDFVYLGDGEKVRVGKQTPQVRKPRLSAKQRRDLKKKNHPKNEASPDSCVNNNSNADEDKLYEADETVTKEPSPKKNKQQQQEQEQRQQQKRGQKGKNKKIKEKYKDQDDEDKELMQQILRSHEPEKPPKKKGKERGKQPNNQVAKQQQQKQQKTVAEKKPDILHAPDDNGLEGIVNNEKDDGDDDVEEQKEDMEKEHVSILDSLTGSPYEEDVLLYAIPLCAPYSCLQSYKYKVKLTPGSGKRGRAAKTAMGMFQMAKEATNWEKDLLKSLKDVDISRNIPGKVKISAPNLQRAKKK